MYLNYIEWRHDFDCKYVAILDFTIKYRSYHEK